jgi:hypothetical protein
VSLTPARKRPRDPLDELPGGIGVGVEQDDPELLPAHPRQQARDRKPSPTARAAAIASSTLPRTIRPTLPRLAPGTVAAKSPVLAATA